MIVCSGMFLCLIVLTLTSPPVLAAPSAVSLDARAERYMTEGLRFFQHGDFEKAVRSWRQAARLYDHETQPRAHSDVLVHLSRAYQALGQHQRTLQSLSTAVALAEQAGDRTHFAAVLGSLGNAFLLIGSAEAAAPFLRQGRQLAQEMHDTGLEAIILNNLGNLFAFQDKYPDAIRAYNKSWALAKQTGNPALAARALTNAARAAIQQGQQEAAKERLDMAAKQLRHVEPSHDKTYSLISLGRAANDLCRHLPEAHDRLILKAAAAFKEAAGDAKRLGDRRAESYAWGYLGALYEQAGRYQEALELTRQAVFAAQQRHIPESLYRWQWQTGRLFKALGRLDEAIQAYKRAVHTVQSLREEAAHGSGQSRFAGRGTVEPVYFELVDLLLQRAALSTSDLIEARNMVELLKAVELQDYFQDECVDAARSEHINLDIVSKQARAAVIYPILLPDRTELLVDLPTGLKRVTVPVDTNRLKHEVLEFRRKLVKQATHEYGPHAQNLYNWLIRLLEADLASVSADIDTLVFVPDGSLRTIPMAALHDGEQFLISKYALAITPGLTLTQPRPLPRDDVKLLALGLSSDV